MKHTLNVYIEKQGKKLLVGHILHTDIGEARFVYDNLYLLEKDARPISISLPLQSQEFSVTATRNFFEGLLPEGFTRHCVAQSLRVSEDDYISILKLMGAECLGALQILSEDAVEKHQQYEMLRIDQLKRLAEEGASKSAEFTTKAHLSLTGASGKVGLYYNDGNWYLPKGSAPSTHIVKQSHVRHREIVANEQLCQLTAAKLGIICPQSFIINIGTAADEEVLLAIKRYDRVISEKSVVLDGLRMPFRLHQEDFAQAMGISYLDKYEKQGDEYLSKMFDLIRKHSAKPMEDQLRLWDITIFNYLIGNTDNHIKNHALLYNSDLTAIRLAPAYDMVSTIAYESISREMGISIGGKLLIDDITRKDFEEESSKLKLGKKIAMARYDAMRDNFEYAINETARELMDIGFNQVEKIKEKIMLRLKKVF